MFNGGLASQEIYGTSFIRSHTKSEKDIIDDALLHPAAVGHVNADIPVCDQVT